jgi:hypothetical protein
MIRFKILQLDEPSLLGFAKAQARRLINFGLAGFTRKLEVDGSIVSLRGFQENDEYIVRLSIINESTTGDPVYSLGAAGIQLLLPAFTVTHKTNKPSVGGSIAIPLIEDIRAALQEGEKVVHVTPYLALAFNEYLVDLSDPFPATSAYTSVVDSDVGQMYWKLASGALRQVDFENEVAWYRDFSTYDNVYQDNQTQYMSWVGLDLTKVNVGYEQTFNVARVDDGLGRGHKIIPDGVQVFQVDMANGRFTVPCAITFTNQIPSFNAATFVKGNWKVAPQGLVAIAVTQNDAEAAKITFKYAQQYTGHTVNFITAGRKTFTLDNVDFGFAVSHQLITEIQGAPFITTDPLPVVVQSLHAEQSIPFSFTNATRIYVTYSDGTRVLVSNNDPVEVYDFTIGDPGPPLSGTTLHTAHVFGPNGLEFDYQFTEVGVVSFDGAVWITGITDGLGYSIRRSVPVRFGFPSTKEMYEIRDADDNVVRQALRVRTGASAIATSGFYFQTEILSSIHDEISRIERFETRFSIAQFSWANLFDAPTVLPNVTDISVIIDLSTKTRQKESRTSR